MQLLKNILVITLAGALTAVQSLLLPSSAQTEKVSATPNASTTKWKWQALKIGVIVIVLGMVGLLVVLSGLVPIKASSGHWPLTAWFLHFAKQRSVGTYALSVDAPALHHPRLVLQGAGHYEMGCAPCHGSPAKPAPMIVQRMTPPPPDLKSAVPQYDAAELFYLVKHGVKFTGMPAWPSLQRDDEVWAMVAFLQQLPQLNAEAYQRLAYDVENKEAVTIEELLPPANVPRVVRENCARCHGRDGQGRQGAFPNLAGQQAEYLFASLQAYAQGTRHSGTMQAMVVGLPLETLRELADYYARLPRAVSVNVASQDAAAIARGALIAQQGIPAQHVPACIACHGPSEQPRNPLYPKLAGQDADYLELQLQLFQRQQRGGTSYAHLMRLPAAGLKAEQRRDVALYYASLP